MAIEITKSLANKRRLSNHSWTQGNRVLLVHVCFSQQTLWPKIKLISGIESLHYSSFYCYLVLAFVLIPDNNDTKNVSRIFSPSVHHRYRDSNTITSSTSFQVQSTPFYNHRRGAHWPPTHRRGAHRLPDYRLIDAALNEYRLVHAALTNYQLIDAALIDNRLIDVATVNNLTILVEFC